MRNRVAATKENQRNLRQRLFAALAMLMVAIILAVGTTYMWLTLSVRPEVSGIITQIGANGSLEIALLNDETYSDPNSVKTPGIGESLAASSPEANERWGNLINLENESYGLSNIVLYPARLNAVLAPTGNGYQVGDKMLSVPSYGYDGRIVALKDNTLAGKYNGTGFVYNSEKIGYGVRAIGSTDTVSVQASYLAEAKSKVAGYTKSAQNSAIGSLSSLKDLITKIAVSSSFNNSDVESLKVMISGLKTAEDYIEDSLRQGLVAIAAAAISEETAFNSLREIIMNENQTISQILGDMKIDAIPDEFRDWVAAQEQMQNDLNAAMAACDAMTDNNHTKDEFRSAMDYIMNLEKVYLGDNRTGKPILQATQADITNLPLTVTLAPGSGVYAIIADFTGNFNADVGEIAKVKTASSELISYMSMLTMVVNELSPAGGGVVSGAVTLKNTYGYALDMAFRCNAFGSDLLLQTDASQRVYSDSTSAATMGGGSYMEFAATGTTETQVVRLMDAIRIAFVDNQGNILAIAKLNISNYEKTEDGSVRAPLYLYEFTIEASGENKGMLVMGERLKESNRITSLDQNIAKAVTTLVWMDGDTIDNTMVSGDSHLTGMLNLQFASSADLSPLDDSALMGYSVDKEALAQVLDANKAIYSAGQGDYTTESWVAFAAAYQYAQTIHLDAESKPIQVDRAGRNLKKAEENLQIVTVQALIDKIAEVRALTGETNVVGAYTVEVEIKDDTGKVTGKDIKTELLADGDTAAPSSAKKKIYRVDYNKNLHDEGNGFLTRIYSDESWKALAEALYVAEGVAASAPSEAMIDEAITNLDSAYKTLSRDIYYQPFDYEGTLYYKAITDVKDTYGTWYDDEFKRIIAELTIINLDAYATPINLANISGDYVESFNTSVSLGMRLITDVYATLSEQTIIANHWTLPDGFGYAGSMKSEIKFDVKSDTFDITELYITPTEQLELSLGSFKKNENDETIHIPVSDSDYVLTGTLLTDAGVLFACEKELNVYTKANGVLIDLEDGTLKTTANSVGELSASLIGGSETIITYKWYLVDSSATTFTINEYTGSWTALKAGTVKVCVQVETEQGNKYTSDLITITIE